MNESHFFQWVRVRVAQGWFRDLQGLGFLPGMSLYQSHFFYVAEKKSTNVLNEGDEEPDAADDSSGESDFLGAAVDFICESSKAKRQAGLRSLIKYLLVNNDSDTLQKYEMTLNNSLFNCMRKGKVEERCQAATAVGTVYYDIGLH